MNVNKTAEQREIEVSVPCRIDLGGTLDISTFYLPMNQLSPSSFNIAIDLRTTVSLSGYRKEYIKVTSKGFETAVFKRREAPFNHPVGLIFACADYFNASGVHINIESSSPPRSALGGSSSAAVATIAAFCRFFNKPVIPEQVAWLAHYIESSAAGVPCGIQDQLAASFGGVNQWLWKMNQKSPDFEQVKIFSCETDTDDFNENIIIAYCGVPHVSKDINTRWVQSFINGSSRRVFEQIAGLTSRFSEAVKEKRFFRAADLMNQETKLRIEMTPDVLDENGYKLFSKAMELNCGARFTGAGGGGCLWAVGEKSDIAALKPLWYKILESVKDAEVLDAGIDNRGIVEKRE